MRHDSAPGHQVVEQCPQLTGSSVELVVVAPPAGQAEHVDTRFYRRRCEESRSDQFASWGASTSYFEVGPDNHPVRQIEAYDRGATLRYGGEHDEDEFGFRSSAELDRSEDWAAWEITRAEFERAWSAAE